MYCKLEPDETLITIKSEWTRQLRDKNLLRAERRSCNSNFSTECQFRYRVPTEILNETYEKYLMFCLEMSSDPKNYFGFIPFD